MKLFEMTGETAILLKGQPTTPKIAADYIIASRPKLPIPDESDALSDVDKFGWRNAEIEGDVIRIQHYRYTGHDRYGKAEYPSIAYHFMKGKLREIRSYIHTNQSHRKIIGNIKRTFNPYVGSVPDRDIIIYMIEYAAGIIGSLP